MRFQLHAIYGMTPTERERLGVDADDDYGSVLEDTTTGATWMDGGEPEDQYFNRDWRWVPTLLNSLAEEAATQRAEIERLTAERAALLAPVEGVDLEEVLRLDSEATQEPWRSYNAAPFKESIPLLTTDEIRRPMVRYEADEQLIVCYRTAAPALAREVIQLRAAVRFADEQGAEAIDRVSRAIVADKWNSTAQLQEEVKRLTAERAAVRAALVDSGTEPVTEDMGRLAALVAAQLADEVAIIARLEQEVGRLQSALGGEIAARQAAEAEVERLTAERATLLAPVEGVDLDDVLRLDHEGTPAEQWTFDTSERRENDRYVRQIVVNQYEEVTKKYDFDDFPARTGELVAALAPLRTDEALIALYRTAAPALAREVIRLRAAHSSTPPASPE